MYFLQCFPFVFLFSPLSIYCLSNIADSLTWATLATWTPSCSHFSASPLSPTTCWSRASLGRKYPSMRYSGTYFRLCRQLEMSKLNSACIVFMILVERCEEKCSYWFYIMMSLIPAGGLLTLWSRRMWAVLRQRRTSWGKWRVPSRPQLNVSLETCRT